MVTLDVCNLCGGQGFVLFFHPLGEALEDDRDTRRCPSCQGTGSIEPWRQLATGVHDVWLAGPSHRMEEAALQAIIRQRENPF